jgi:outer membrane protein insertion porin family
MKKILLLLLLVGNLVSLPVAAFQNFTVNSIRVVGLHRVSEGAVLEDLPIHIGQNLTESSASEAIQALYKTGFFKEVTLSRDGNVLVVHVTERPTISKLTLTGLKDKDKIKKQLRESGLAEGQLYDPAVLLKAQKELERYYLSKGKYAVKIESKVSDETNSLVDVELDIYEGDAAKIREIKINGNCVFPEKELLKQLRLSKTNWLSWFTNDNQYNKEKLNADLETLRSYYMDRGYINFQVDSSQASLSANKKHIYITIHVTEGDRYYFGNVALSGQYVVPRRVLVPLLEPLEGGCVFSRKALLEVKQALETRLGDDGYSLAEARPNHEIDEANKRVNIDFQMVPGKRMYVRRILIQGNSTTKDEVLRRELPQMEGTWISTALVREGREKILRKGFGTNVDIETMLVPESPDQLDIVYKLEEARMGQVGAGLGYSPTEHLMFNFSLSQENFLGTGKAVDFTFDKSKASTNYAIGYQDPYFTVDMVGMGFSAYYNKCNLSKTSDVVNYTADTLGTEVRWVLPLGKYEALRLSLGYDDTRIKLPGKQLLAGEIAREIIRFTKIYGYRFDEFVVGLGWNYDSLDQRIFPKRGMTHALGARAVIPEANQQYYRLTYDFAGFYPINGSDYWIVSLSSNLGFGDGYGKGRDGKRLGLPFYRNFVAGGTRFVRGFEENSLGPKETLYMPGRGSFFGDRAIGGNMLVAATASIIFPNPINPDIKSIRTALFFDAGQVYDTRYRHTVLNGIKMSRNPRGLRYSVGISLTWHTPLGGTPLSFSLAKPLNVKVGDKKRPFTFWMGSQF